MEITIGTRLKQLREELGISQIELAKIFNISNTALSQYESGNRTPSDDLKVKLADYFDVSLDFLMGKSNSRRPENSLTEKDEKDIAKTMQKLKEQLANDKGLMFDGDVLDEETAKLLLDAIEQQEKLVKTINKKYTPNKYKK